jgi:hypothetical protein
MKTETKSRADKIRATKQRPTKEKTSFQKTIAYLPHPNLFHNKEVLELHFRIGLLLNLNDKIY